MSFAKEDRFEAGWIVQELRKAGYQVVYQHSQFVPGTNWPSFIVEAARWSRRTIGVLSPAYEESDMARVEWAEAMRLDPLGVERRLIPVRIEDFAPATLLGQYQYIDLVGLAEDESRKCLLDGLAAAIGGEWDMESVPFRIPARRTPRAPVRTTANLPPPVPALPPQYVERTPLLAGVRDLLLRARETPGATAVGLVGMGGSGKSTLARAAAADAEVRSRFDEVLWVEAGPATEPTECQYRLSAALGDGRPVSDVTSGLERLRELVAGEPRLVVVDDVWHREQLDALDLTGSSCVLLVTTRVRDVLARRGPVCPVEPLDSGLGHRVLAAWAGRTAEGLPPEATEVVEACGGLALALAAAGGLIADGWSWESVLTRLRQVDLVQLRADFPDYPQPHLMAAFDVSVSLLDAASRERYLRLAVFEGRAPVPIEVAGLLWRAEGLTETPEVPGGSATVSDPAVEDVFVALARRSLLQYDATTRHFTLHDLQFAYIRHTVGATSGLRRLHHSLASAFLERWGGLHLGLPVTASVDFGTDPVDRYGLAHLVAHLASAGDHEDVHALLALEGHLFTAVGRSLTPSNLWFGVQERIGETVAWLRDLAIARGLAEDATDRAEGGAGADSIGLEVRYALMRGSATSVAANIPSDLLPALVEHGVWTTDQALAYARVTAAHYDRANALLGLLPTLPTAPRARLAREIATAAVERTDLFQVGTLGRLAVELTEQQRRDFAAEALRRVRTSVSRFDSMTRQEVLRGLAELVPAEQREEVLGEALAAARRPNAFGDHDVFAESEILTDLAALASGPRRKQLLTEALTATRAMGASGLACHRLIKIAALQQGLARGRTLRRALRAARKDDSLYSRVDALVSLARELPGPRRGRLLSTAFAMARDDSRTSGIDPWSTLVPDLPEHLLPEALKAVRSLPDPADRCGALRSLEKRVSPAERPSVLADALAAARAVPPDRGQRARQLSYVAERLPHAQRLSVITEALTSARAIHDQAELSSAYAAVARHLPPPHGDEVTDRAIALVHTLPSDGRLRTLRSLLPHVEPPRSTRVAEEVLDLVTADSWPALALGHAAADLPETVADRAVRLALDLDVSDQALSPHYRAMALAHLSGHLPAHLVLPVGRQLMGLHSKLLVPALRKLAPRMSGEELGQTADTAEKYYNDYGMAFVLIALAPCFPEPGRRELLRDLYAFARDGDDAQRRCELTVLLASCLPEIEALPVLADAQAQARLIPAPESRAEALTDIANALPPERRTEVCHEALAAAEAATSLDADEVFRMGQVALAASATTTAVWRDFWRPVLRRAATVGRATVAHQTATAARDITRLGVATTPAAVVRALDDVTRWWP
ncbi:TIR domain-containing protein [Streptomyces avermitilis]